MKRYAFYLTVVVGVASVVVVACSGSKGQTVAQNNQGQTAGTGGAGAAGGAGAGGAGAAPGAPASAAPGGPLSVPPSPPNPAGLFANLLGDWDVQSYSCNGHAIAGRLGTTRSVNFQPNEMILHLSSPEHSQYHGRLTPARHYVFTQALSVMEGLNFSIQSSSVALDGRVLDASRNFQGTIQYTYAFSGNDQLTLTSHGADPLFCRQVGQTSIVQLVRHVGSDSDSDTESDTASRHSSHGGGGAGPASDGVPRGHGAPGGDAASHHSDAGSHHSDAGSHHSDAASHHSDAASHDGDDEVSRHSGDAAPRHSNDAAPHHSDAVSQAAGVASDQDDAASHHGDAAADNDGGAASDDEVARGRHRRGGAVFGGPVPHDN